MVLNIVIENKVTVQTKYEYRQPFYLETTLISPSIPIAYRQGY